MNGHRPEPEEHWQNRQFDEQPVPVPDKVEANKDDKIINHIRNIKLLQAIHSGKKFYVGCCPTDKGAKCFPNSNMAVKEIELPNFDLYEEKFGYAWQSTQSDAGKQSGEHPTTTHLNHY